ncbi:hypothetical protein JCM11251_007419 [Rhodosporidiobolus azoricus]
MPHPPLPPSPLLSMSSSPSFKHRPHLAPLKLPSFGSERTEVPRGGMYRPESYAPEPGGRDSWERRAAQEVEPPEEGGNDERVEAWRTDAQDESFVSLAALHDPTLFGDAQSPREEEEPESPSGLEVDFGRRRRARHLREGDERTSSIREASMSRSVVSSVGMTRKMLGSSGRMKGEPSIQVQVKDIGSTPPAIVSPTTPPPISSSSFLHDRDPSYRSRHTRGGSSASDQLLRLQSTSPSSPLSSPSSTHKRQFVRPACKRRYSSAAAFPTHDGEKLLSSPSASPLVRANSHHDQPPIRCYGSVAALSACLDAGRRSSLPMALHTESALEAPAEPRGFGAGPVATLEEGVDLVGQLADHLPPNTAPSTSFFGSLSTHFPSLPSFHVPHPYLSHYSHNISPSPVLPSAASSSSPSSAYDKTKQVSWSSICALSVRFRPVGFGLGCTTSTSIATDSSSSASNGNENGSDSSLGLNHFVLGLQDLAAGGTRSWDPRLISRPSPAPSQDKEDEKLGAVAQGGYDTWPTIRTEVGAPPRVEVMYKDGGRRVCEAGGMEAEEIMRAVLSGPA